MAHKQPNLKCDLHVAKGSKHRGLSKFWINDMQFILVCSDCLTELVRHEYEKQAASFGINWSAAIQAARPRH